MLASILLGVSVALGVWIWTEFATPPLAGDAVAPAAMRLPAAPRVAAGDGGQRRREEVAMILARPVFSATRRPKPDAAAALPASAQVTALPRMTAILIDGNRRSAIFAGDGKPTVLNEGGHLGPFTIQTIEPQQVTVMGPEGKRVVRTSFSNDPPAAAVSFPNALPAGLPFPPAAGAVVLPPGFPVPAAVPGAASGPSR